MEKKRRIAIVVVAAVFLAACGNRTEGETVPTPASSSAEAVVSPAAGSSLPGDSETASADYGKQIEEIHTAVKAAYGDNYIPSMLMTEQENSAVLVQEIYGLERTWYDAAIIEVPLMSTYCDLFLVVHPTAGNEENVHRAVAAYRDYLVEDSFQYPMNLLKIQGATMAAIGEYECLFILGKVDETAYVGNAELVKAFQEQNQIAVDTVKKTLGIE